MRKLAIFSCVLLMIASACSNYKIDDSGVTVKVKKSETAPAQTVRVQVISDDIFRVTAIPTGEFSSKASLSVIVADSVFKGWKNEKSGDTIIITTATTRALISLGTGKVSFTDLQGNLILGETSGGRTFQDTTIDGKSGYSFRQVYDSPDDEAIYGLGQHQSEEMNYKGKNEVLFQYNTKVSMPFIVSTKNYGILWDNYSLSRYGDSRDFSQLSAFKLFDKDGNEGGLTATYYENSDTSKVFLRQQEKEINYENLETVKKFPAKFPFYGSTITWEGQIEAPADGIYRFGLYYAGYTRIWIDGNLMADKWRTAWNPNLAKFNVDMKSGEKHRIKLEWKPDGGISYIGLRVMTPVNPEEQKKVAFWSEMGDQLDYYFIHGNSMDNVISGYRQL